MKQKIILGFTQNVFILSFVSFLNDIGGETIKRTIPLFLVNVLGVSTSIVGLVEGITDATPHLFQPFVGYLSDRIGKRKPFVLGSQLLRTAMVFLFFATSWIQVLIVRFLDRSAKGINTAPRDALIAASTQGNTVGKSFGLSRALDNAGAVVGLILAGLITLFLSTNQFHLTRNAFQLIVLLAIIPQLIAFFLILLYVRDVPVQHLPKEEAEPLALRQNRKFIGFLIVSFLFTLGNSSDAFMILRSQGLGMSIPAIFFLIAAMSLTSSVINIPAGSASDRLGRKKLLTLGWLVYGLTYIGFAKATSVWLIILLFLANGLYYGLTEGAAKALVSDLVIGKWRGTAFGIYNVVTGLTLFPASLIAGVLWQAYSPSIAFLFGACMSLIAVFLLQLILPKTAVSVERVQRMV